MTNAERHFTESIEVRAPGLLRPEWIRDLTRVTVDQNSGVPDAATLVFRDPSRTLLDTTGISIGTQLTVAVRTDGATGPALFTGEVTALELDHELHASYTVVRALARTHRLWRNQQVRAFRRMTAAAIVRKVLTTAKLTPGRIDLRPITYTQLSQAGESDWEFLTRLAAEHGATVRTDEQGRVEVAPPARAAGAPAPTASAQSNAMVLEYGRNLRSLRAALTSAGQVDTVRVRSWNPDTKTAMTARKRMTASASAVPGLAVRSALSKFPGLGPTTELRTDRAYGTQAEVTAAATVLADSISAGQAEFEAVVDGNPGLRADTPIALAGVGTQFAGRYTASSVLHVFEPEQPYRCVVGVSASPDRSLAALTGAPGPAPGGPRISGVVTAVVTSVGGDRRNDPRGLVKLKFPWLDETYQSDWVRTVQFGGVGPRGRGGGGVLCPDVNDEVLVAFEHGLLDRPYVVGGLYNGKDRPGPHTGNLLARGAVRRRSLSAREGHRIELIDGALTPGVLLASADDGLQVRLDEKAGSIELSVARSPDPVTLAPGRDGRIELVVSTALGRRTLTLDRDGITLDAGTGALTLTGQSVRLEGQTSVAVNGRASVRIDGAMVTIN